MAKLPDPLSTLSPDARRVYDKITAKRGQMKGDELGMPGLIELVTLAGQYRLIAGVLFAFDSPLPEGTPAPF